MDSRGGGEGKTTPRARVVAGVLEVVVAVVETGFLSDLSEE